MESKEQREKVLTDHLNRISIEIAKVDETVSTTLNMPVDEIRKLTERRQKLTEVADYCSYLLAATKGLLNQQQDNSGGRILTMNQ